ncbi:MAG: class I SAM-dependent DNA methyltransferase [Nitrososphaerota archaeon]
MQGEGLLNQAGGHDPPIGSRRPRRPGAAETASSSARTAYDRYAAIYDRANADNDYEMWLGNVLLPELEERGLRTGWALDVGCGTGRAFEPLLRRGWQLVGCDSSAGMLDEARRKFGGQVPLHELDARDLPPLHLDDGSSHGSGFQLVLLLNDVLNYLTEAEDLNRVFAGVARNLSPAGLAAFDVNTLELFRQDFDPTKVEQGDGWEWRGLTPDPRPEGIYEARLGGPNVEPHVHRQRHWPPGRIAQALEAAGLAMLASLGQREAGGRVLLSATPDENRDRKIVYIAKRGERRP